MRIARIDLLSYGKFTDRSLALPQAKRDFHLIVGPNEAGKSTLRYAILDLLFGIEHRSRYNFVHAYSDMRLGARLEHGDDSLDFVRIKARNKTLRSLDGAVLADDALVAFLGAVERGFFEQMFGLDHERLVDGGREILNASNDVGRILFQSAAGIGSLGEVRDALEKEADALWAKRRSNEREYYLAEEDLKRAEADLKQAIVRTRDWVAARNQVSSLEEARGEARAHYRELEQERVRLDRMRRVAPLLATLSEREEALAGLGAVVVLPPEAGERLARAELAVATAGKARELHAEQAERCEARIGAIHPDAALLARGADIQALSEQRQQLRNHRNDIDKRQDEVRAHWKAIEGLVRQLGWPVEDEERLERRIPSRLVRAAIGALLRRHDAVRQTLAAAEEAQAAREVEIRTLEGEMQTLPVADTPLALKEALAAARAMGDVAAQERRLEAQQARAQRELDAALPELGPWQADIDRLRRVQLPPQEEMGTLLKRHADLEATGVALAERIDDAQSALRDLDLGITQYRTAHHPVSLDELQRARAERDGVWQGIRSGGIELSAAAPDYEARVAGADALSDQRHDKAQEASELQARLDQRERLAGQLDDLRSRQAANAQDQIQFAGQWAARMAAIGLADLPLTQVGSWRAARERVLRTADAAVEAGQALNECRGQATAARAALEHGLRGIDTEAGPLSVAALVLRAGEIVEAANRSRERRAALAEQKARAERSLADNAVKLTQARTGLEAWQAELHKHLRAAHLPPDADVGTLDGALSLFEQIDEHLRQMRELRSNRIEAMRRDLDGFAARARELAQAVAPELAQQADEEVARVLAQRLGEATEADRELRRLRGELEEVGRKLADAQVRIQEAHAELQPLLNLAGVSNNGELRIAIQRSDEARTLTADVRAALLALREAGDGLSREALAAECAAGDLAGVPGELAELKARVEESLERQNRLAAELNSAEQALGRIAGQAEAARAESLRQEALARMANAVQRYVKVFTAARLLRWAIERYRETRQGPMLSRAGDIFSALTLGSFARLVVDYDSDPLTLYGQRTSGEHVAIEGMSDGSRDQLYLALRLAALELHLQQAPAMPFIADDLFINYDDPRSKAGLEALARLSELTQVIFLSHHDHLLPLAESVFGPHLNVVRMT